MNELSRSSTPYDLNVLSDVERTGWQHRGLSGRLRHPLTDYAEAMEQISLYEADLPTGNCSPGSRSICGPSTKPCPNALSP